MGLRLGFRVTSNNNLSKRHRRLFPNVINNRLIRNNILHTTTYSMRLIPILPNRNFRLPRYFPMTMHRQVVSTISRINVHNQNFTNLNGNNSSLYARVLQNERPNYIRVGGTNMNTNFYRLRRLNGKSTRLLLRALSSPRSRSIFRMSSVPRTTLINGIYATTLQTNSKHYRLSPRRAPYTKKRRQHDPLFRKGTLRNANNIINNTRRRLNLPTRLNNSIYFRESRRHTKDNRLKRRHLQRTRVLRCFQIVLLNLNIRGPNKNNINMLPHLRTTRLPRRMFQSRRGILNLYRPPNFFINVRLVGTIRKLRLSTNTNVGVFGQRGTIRLVRRNLHPVITMNVSQKRELPIFRRRVIRHPYISKGTLGFQMLNGNFPSTLLRISRRTISIPFRVAIRPPSTVKGAMRFFNTRGTILRPSRGIPPTKHTGISNGVVFLRGTPPI